MDPTIPPDHPPLTGELSPPVDATVDQQQQQQGYIQEGAEVVGVAGSSETGEILGGQENSGFVYSEGVAGAQGEAGCVSSLEGGGVAGGEAGYDTGQEGEGVGVAGQDNVGYVYTGEMGDGGHEYTGGEGGVIGVGGVGGQGGFVYSAEEGQKSVGAEEVGTAEGFVGSTQVDGMGGWKGQVGGSGEEGEVTLGDLAQQFEAMQKSLGISNEMMGTVDLGFQGIGIEEVLPTAPGVLEGQTTARLQSYEDIPSGLEALQRVEDSSGLPAVAGTTDSEVPETLESFEGHFEPPTTTQQDVPTSVTPLEPPMQVQGASANVVMEGSYAQDEAELFGAEVMSAEESEVTLQPQPQNSESPPVTYGSLSNTSPQVTPQEYPQDGAQEYPQVTPQDYPQVSPQDYPQVSPQDYPQVSSQDYPQVSPQEYPQVSPQEYPQVSPQEYPQVSPQEYPQVSPQEYPQVSPQEYPQVSPQEYPQVSPQEYPQVTPQEYPQVSPQDYAQDEPLQQQGDIQAPPRFLNEDDPWTDDSEGESYKPSEEEDSSADSEMLDAVDSSSSYAARGMDKMPAASRQNHGQNTPREEDKSSPSDYEEEEDEREEEDDDGAPRLVGLLGGNRTSQIHKFVLDSDIEGLHLYLEALTAEECQRELLLRDGQGRTALHIALTKRDVACTQELVTRDILLRPFRRQREAQRLTQEIQTLELVAADPSRIEALQVDPQIEIQRLRYQLEALPVELCETKSSLWARHNGYPCTHLSFAAGKEDAGWFLTSFFSAENEGTCLENLFVIGQSRDGHGRTPLHVGAMLGESRVMRGFLDGGIVRPAHTRDSFGFTFVHYLVGSHNVALLTELLSEVQILRTQEFLAELYGDQYNILEFAVSRCSWECFKVLLDFGRSLGVQNIPYPTCTEIAASLGVEDLFHSSMMTPEAPLKVDNRLTLVLTDWDCARHLPLPQDTSTQAHSRGRKMRMVSENETRMEVLVGSHGALRSEEFQGVCWIDEEVLPIHDADILRVHSADYYRRLREAVKRAQDYEASMGQVGYVSIDADTRVSGGSLDAAKKAAGSVKLATEKVITGEFKNAFCVVRPPGHHMGPNGAVDPDLDDDPENSQGFCLFNNVCIGTAYAMSRGVSRVAIIDVDVHHGNGTEACVRSLRVRESYSKTVRQKVTLPGFGELDFQASKTVDPRPWRNADSDYRCVFFASSHVYAAGSFYPFSGPTAEYSLLDNDRINVVNVGLDKGSDSQTLRQAYVQNVFPALRAFEPEMIFISAGFDGHRDDVVSNGACAFDERDYYWLTEQLLCIARESPKCAGRIVSVLEGGYNTTCSWLSPLAQSATEHLRALSRSHARRSTLELEAPEEVATGVAAAAADENCEDLSAQRELLLNEEGAEEAIDSSPTETAEEPITGSTLKRTRDFNNEDYDEYEAKAVKIAGAEG